MLIRPIQYRDLESVRKLYDETEKSHTFPQPGILKPGRGIHRLYGAVKLLSFFRNPMQSVFCVHVAQMDGQIVGIVQVRPINTIHSTWQVEHIAVSPEVRGQGIGTRLLRHVFEYYREARNWTVEVDIHNKGGLALYRQNGFQSLAQFCYWRLSSQVLTKLSMYEGQALNLRPVSNADASLLCQLDASTMPPMVRQIYDRHPNDFQRGVMTRALGTVGRLVNNTRRVAQYVYEKERQAAIGAFDLLLSSTGLEPHYAHLLVHPAYTWLYPQLAVHMACILQNYPPQALHLVSTDYQSEREEFLESLDAEVLERKLLMSRSVWHKVRESRKALEGLQIPEMLPGFSMRPPIAERIQQEETRQDPPSTGW